MRIQYLKDHRVCTNGHGQRHDCPGGGAGDLRTAEDKAHIPSQNSREQSVHPRPRMSCFNRPEAADLQHAWRGRASTADNPARKISICFADRSDAAISRQALFLSRAWVAS